MLQKLNFHKYAGSSFFSDFMAGVEPTGKYTFENASKNQQEGIKNHGMHRFMGDVGGFIGGGALAVATGAAGLYGGAKLLQKIHPNSSTAGHLIQGAKDQIGMFNPLKTFRTLKNYSEAKGLVGGSLKNLRGISEHYDDAVNMTRTKNFDITPEKVDSIKDVLTKTKDNMEGLKTYKATHGEEASDTVRRTLGILGGGAAFGIGGGMNALSAHVQYNAGRDLAKKMKNDKKQTT